MATESYEAAIKGLNDLLRYDQTFSLLCLKGQRQSLDTECVGHIHLHRSTIFVYMNPSSLKKKKMNPSSFDYIFLNYYSGVQIVFDVETEKKKGLLIFCACFNSHDPRHFGFVVHVRLILAVHHAFTLLFSLFTPIFTRLFHYLSSKKTDLGNVAAEKIKGLTQELKELDSSNNDAVERIKSGFTHFKTEKYL